MDKIRVDGFNGLRFSARRNGCFTPPVSSGSPYSGSLVTSTSESLRVSQAGINPNKAVFTIERKTSQILIVNRNACELLGYTPNELCSMQLSNLLSNKKKNHVSALAEGQLNSEDGTMVLLSGKVVEMTTKHATKVAVSLWIRQIDDKTCLAIAELVERRISQITIDRNGTIISGDYEALLLFQLESVDQFTGMDIHSVIPAIQLPSSDSSMISKNIEKQKATGKTTDGISFPLCLMISHQDNGADSSDSGMSNSSCSYVVTVWVFQNISGLLVIDENGLIESCNHHFANLMFGYTQNKIIGMDIINLIPNFGQEIYYLGCTRSRNATTSSLDNDESETETEDIINQSECISNSGMACVDISKALSEPVNIGAQNSISKEFKDSNPSSLLLKSTSENIFMIEDCENNRNAANVEKIQSFDLPTPVNEDCSLSESLSISKPQKRTADSYEAFNMIDSCNLSELSKNDNCDKEDTNDVHLFTSTPCARRFSNMMYARPMADGRYKGEAVHCDENLIDIVYTISKQMLPCGRKVYCVWICRDPDIENDIDENGKHQNLTLTFNSVNSTIENSLGQAIRYTAAQNSSRPNSVSLLSQCEDDQVSGDYNNYYTTLKQIGEGAYGYVKMAYRHQDRLLVITKFILKEKLMPHCMVLTEEKRNIPMEIYLLKTVKHPNIVTVLDVFENEKYFQLVMEKHGSGMDLFEFIDRRPHMDEVLACYIFRQIANAVDYLHSMHILHRDIKDENVIIDQHFHVKLIDFGSATFMEEGRLFSTFYGTTEYCSPEVLAGNKYAGPELEMWSMGVTLYVLLFVENPFLDIEETLRAELKLPHIVSGPLNELLFSMLDKNPKTRCTMKQLLANSWIRQEINPAMFKFSQIVSLVDPHEANPDKYYTGQVYSSNTGLSTASPHSLSLADEDSEEVEIEDEEETSLPSQEESFCDKCANISTNLTRADYISRGNKLELYPSEIESKSEDDPGKVNELSDAIETISCKQCGRNRTSKMTSYKITSISDSI
ncbi:PAS domain-containing serine/threonine-protein kinase isoform X2 [Bradysia coprophila]|nr:PAS domain-containing serine/threonine-protein kinase isoform X2 [Bradysia coprophila]XP_037046489.1 PAS domain-containing serine/threonine-protein kinase isoform X2 [Bradysia coprophila]